MMSSGISTISTVSSSTKSRFPRLQECAHFHYEVSTVDLPKNFNIIMCTDNESIDNIKPNINSALNTLSTMTTFFSDNTNNSHLNSDNIWFTLQVTSYDKKWFIYRTYENFRYLDKYLHDCIFDRKFSSLEELSNLNILNSSHSVSSLLNNEMTSSTISSLSTMSSVSSSKKIIHNSKVIELNKNIRNNLSSYLKRLGDIIFINPINCGPILNWFEIDNKGNRLFATDDSPINIPGVAAAVVKKRYVAQGLDEISLDVGNMISVIDMPPADESVWWRGKKELEVGFFPSECVEIIKCNQSFSNNTTENFLRHNQSVRLKHGKLITLLRSFFNSRPARNQLQSKGILKQRVFACDLGEHLSNSHQDVPRILKICTQFIEKHGIVDGIYRHTGLQSNIQKLRNAFDEEKFNEINQEVYVNDVHSVSSLLKMYFRELPNPLLTYQLYHKFISIAESLMRAVNVEDKIFEIYDVVQQLPPPHYRTLSFLMRHLHKLAEYSSETSMNTKNLAIVWAPNLLKSKEMDSIDYMHYDMLHSITLQANISEFLITNADTIFNDKFSSLVKSRDFKDKSYRPISVCHNMGFTKLLSIEEAQDKYKQVGPTEIPKFHTVIDMPELKKKINRDRNKNTSSLNPASYPISSNQVGPIIPLNSTNNGSINMQNQPQNEMQKTHGLISTEFQTVSSPVFKCLFRNLRVGSIKCINELPPTGSSPNIQNQQSSSLISISQTQSNSLEVDNSKQPNPLPQNSVRDDSNIKLNTSSTTRATNTTFKPLVSSSTYGITNINDFDSKINLSNYIKETKANAATLISSPQNLSSNISTFTGCLNQSNKVCSNNSTESIFSRTDKLNHPEGYFKSTESNNMSNQISTFNQTSEKIPIPFKRRTIQAGPQILMNSNSSSNFNTFLPSSSPILSQSSDHTNDETNLNLNLCINENNKENITSQRSSRKSLNLNFNNNNDDEMLKIVSYMKKFEKDNISKTVEVDQNFQVGNVEINPLTPSPCCETSNNEIVDSINDLQSIEQTSKLRLSSSSLSSSNDSTNETNYDNKIQRCSNVQDAPITTTILKITSNELNTVIVTTQNLNSILSSNTIDQSNIESRTDYLNRIYDNFNEKNYNEISSDNKSVLFLENNEKLNNTIITKKQDANKEFSIKNTQNFSNQNLNDHIYMNVNGVNEKIVGINPSEINNIESQKETDTVMFVQTQKVEKNFDTELVELNQQINGLLKSTNQNKASKHDSVTSLKTRSKNVFLKNPIENDPKKSKTASISLCKSSSVDEIKCFSPLPYVKPTDSNILKNDYNFNRNSFRERTNINELTESFNTNNQNDAQKNEFLKEFNFTKRKSSICFDELKRRKPDPNSFDTKTKNYSHKNLNDEKLCQSNLNSQQSKNNLITKNLCNQNINISKSLQDNSKLIIKGFILLNNDSDSINNNIDFQLDESINKNRTDNQILMSKNNILDENEESLNVKTKIKLIESITCFNSSGNINTLIKSDKNHDKSGSSSSSSSRSPTLTTRVKHKTENNQLKSKEILEITSLPSIVSRSDTIELTNNLPVISKENTKSIPNKETEIEIKNKISNNSAQNNNLLNPIFFYNSETLKNDDDDEIEKKTRLHSSKPDSLSNFKERRQTVKELLSKFETK